MYFNTRFFSVVFLILVWAPLEAMAYQIAPNPNYGKIRINPGEVAENNENFYNHYYILDWGELTNNSEVYNNYRVYVGFLARLHNYGNLTNNFLGTKYNYLPNKSWGTIYNYGELNNFSGGELTNYNRLINANVGALSNHGVFMNKKLLANKGVLTIHSGGFLENSGTLVVAEQGELTNQAGGTLINHERLNNFGDNLINFGSLVNRGTIYNNGRLINYGELTTYRTVKTFKGSELINQDGAILTNRGTFKNFGSDTIINNVGGTVYNLGEMYVSNNFGRVENRGRLLRCGINYSGATLDNFGELSASLTNYGSLTNYSRFKGELTNYGEFTNLGYLSNFSLHNYGSITNNKGRLANRGSLINHFGAALDNFSLFLTVGPLINEGILHNYSHFGNHGFLINEGRFTNLGSFSSSALLENYGTWTNASSGSVVINRNTLTNHAGAELKNEGTLTNIGQINGAGAYTQSGGKTVNNGSLEQATVTILGGSLSGVGTITGALELGDEAVLMPGNQFGRGKLTVNGTLASSGSLEFTIYGGLPGENGVLDINGEAWFNGGEVEFNFRNFMPSVGDSWDFLLAEAISGWETLTCTLNAPQRLGWDIEPFAGGERLVITAVYTPIPSGLALMSPVLVVLLLARRRRRPAP